MKTTQKQLEFSINDYLSKLNHPSIGIVYIFDDENPENYVIKYIEEFEMNDYECEFEKFGFITFELDENFKLKITSQF